VVGELLERRGQQGGRDDEQAARRSGRRIGLTLSRDPLIGDADGVPGATEGWGRGGKQEQPSRDAVRRAQVAP
jgi:hypothetical protein